MGRAYVPFPDPKNNRIRLEELEHEATRQRLRAIWLDPYSLDPSRISARVTVEVAGHLANLARDLENTYPSERVASFLLRCIFTFFAEDIRLLPDRSFTNLLQSFSDDLPSFKPMVESLWRTMNSGGHSDIVRGHVLRFNGGLFESVEALPVNSKQLVLLLLAAKQDWRDVEPAIFGTLLERALDKKERHRPGAHYTPRAYVERLVLPTVIEPLRRDWVDAQAAAATLERTGKTDAAIEILRAFHKQLCNTEVLDPACGSGNFLYVTLEHLKRLEGEVLVALESLGEKQQALRETGLEVDPHQLKGIELNPRAAAITDLVLWIGYLQWYFRNRGADAAPPEPVIKRFHNIESRDALLAYDSVEDALDANGQPITQWDGITRKQDPITDKEVPDESARRNVVRYINPRRAPWPSAQFIVGNPPFLGNWMSRGALGDGYTEALRGTYSEVPESADYVMYWWHRAALLLREPAGTEGTVDSVPSQAKPDKRKPGNAQGEWTEPTVPDQAGTPSPSPSTAQPRPLRRFGFITTNSIRQTFQRRVLVPHLTDPKSPISLVFAIPDHPWVDSSNGAAVRIAMTVAEAGSHEGTMFHLQSEDPGQGEGRPKLPPRDRQSPSFAACKCNNQNLSLSCPIPPRATLSLVSTNTGHEGATMPHNQKSAADQAAEAKAKAAGIPYVKRTWDNLKDSAAENAPNKPTEPPAKHEPSPDASELTGQPEPTPKASPAKDTRAVSNRKKTANKANAQKSTGPRTQAGKARVSENALKHGLRSEQNPLDISTQIPGEQTHFEDLFQDFDSTYQPANRAELQLVARLTQLTLRLNRAAQMESATIDQSRTDAVKWADQFRNDFPDQASPGFEIAIMANTFSRASAQLKLLSQYESRLSHDFARTLRQLLQLQKLRKQTQPALNPKEEPLRPQPLGTDLTVPSGPETSSSNALPPPRVDGPVCPPTNPRSRNEPQSLSENFDQTNPTQPLDEPLREHNDRPA